MKLGQEAKVAAVEVVAPEPEEEELATDSAVQTQQPEQPEA